MYFGTHYNDLFLSTEFVIKPMLIGPNNTFCCYLQTKIRTIIDVCFFSITHAKTHAILFYTFTI